MKTKIRTLSAIFTFGIIGVMNINAISDNKKEVANDKAEMLAIESVMTDEAFTYSAQAFSTADIENEIDEYKTIESLAEEILLSDQAIIYSPQAFSTVDIENEIQEIETDQFFPPENAMTNKVKYSAKAFSDLDFENEVKNFETDK